MLAYGPGNSGDDPVDADTGDDDSVQKRYVQSNRLVHLN